MDLSPVWKRTDAMYTAFIGTLPNIVLAVVVFVLFCLVGGWVRSLVRRVAERYHRHRNLGFVLGRLSQGALIFVGLLVSLSIALPTFRAGDLVQLLGIGSVAIGFAFRDIFQNFLAGILLLLAEPFRIGDQIIVQHYEGTVEDIQTRATFIRTYDGRRVVIPNAVLFTESVTVNTAFPQRRTEYDVGIGYGDDINEAKRLILEAVRDVPGVLRSPPPAAIVVRLADFNVAVRVWWWTKPEWPNVLDVQDRVLSTIKRTLMENGIDLPFPTQQVLFHDQTEETDGDRARQREGWPTGKQASPRPRRVVDALGDLARPEAGTGGRNDRRETPEG